MTFLEAFRSIGPDVEAIAKLLDIPPAEADHLINEEMDRQHRQRRETQRSYQRDYNLRHRAALREIRFGRSA